MNVHVFATAPFHHATAHHEASILVHDARAAEAWRDVPLPPLDAARLARPDDLAGLDDFVHTPLTADPPQGSTSLSPPTPGQARSRSDKSHSQPFQAQSLSYVDPGEQSDAARLVLALTQPLPPSWLQRQPTASPDVSWLGNQLSAFPLPSLSSFHHHSTDVSLPRALIPLPFSYDTPQTMPPNQAQLYDNICVESQESLYRSDPRPLSNSAGGHAIASEQPDSQGSLYASHAPALSSQARPEPTPGLGSSHPSHFHGASPSLQPPPHHQPSQPVASTGESDSQEPPGLRFLHTPSAPVQPASADVEMTDSQPDEPGPPGSLYFASRHEEQSRVIPSFQVPSFEQAQRETESAEDPPGLFYLPSTSGARQEQSEGEDMDISKSSNRQGRSGLSYAAQPANNLGDTATRGEEDKHDGENMHVQNVQQLEGWSQLSHISAFLRARRMGSLPADNPAFSLEQHDEPADADSGMGESGADFLQPMGPTQDEMDDDAIEQDLTAPQGMLSSSPLAFPSSFAMPSQPQPQPDSQNSQDRQSTAPNSQDSQPSVHWSQILTNHRRYAPASASQLPPLREHSSSHPPQPHPSQPYASQPYARPSGSAERHVSSGSPVPSAYLPSEDALARAYARETWGERYDGALRAAYSKRRENDDADPYTACLNDGLGSDNRERTPSRVLSQGSRAAEDGVYGDGPLEDEPEGEAPLGGLLRHSQLSSEDGSTDVQSILAGLSPPPPQRHAERIPPFGPEHTTPRAAPRELPTARRRSHTPPRTYRPPTLPALPGEEHTVVLPFASQLHPRPPSDTVVPDSQSQELRDAVLRGDEHDGAQGDGGRARRRRIERPEELGWVLPTPHTYLIPTRQYVPPAPTPDSSYHSSQDSLYGPSRPPPNGAASAPQASTSAAAAAVAPPDDHPADVFAAPDPLLYRFPSRAPPPHDAPAEARQHSAAPVPRALAPFTAQTAEDFLTAPYSRCAWIVPVRGTPGGAHGWGATGASVLALPPARNRTTHGGADAAEDAEALLPFLLPTPAHSTASNQDTPGAITWTADVLRQLWTYLVRLRAARKCGLVALAYVLAPAAASQRDGHEGGPGGPLDDVDYIRVSLDARYAMLVRHILHLWRYDCTLPPAIVEVRRRRDERARAREERERTPVADEGEGGRKRKREGEGAGGGDAKGKGKEREREKKEKREDVASYRMFLGARLVLLDEYNRAVLTC